MGYNNVDVKVGSAANVINALQDYNTVILKPNIVDNRNVLTQSMMNEKHTKYVIRWNYILDGGTVTVPEDCIVEFAGGTIDNGVIVGNNTRLMYSKPIDEICKAERQGTWIYDTTVADEEDITSVEGHLKFKDRPATDGMGKVILRKNKSFASQVTEPNTIYVIQYDFDLGGEEVTIPENCVLEFDGGSLSKGTITGTNTGINASLIKIFNTDVIFAGSWNVTEAYPEWFGAVGDGITNCSSAFTCLNSFVACMQIVNITIKDKYKTYQGIYINGKQNVNISGGGHIILHRPTYRGKSYAIHSEDSLRTSVTNITVTLNVDDRTVVNPANENSWGYAVVVHNYDDLVGDERSGVGADSIVIEGCTFYDNLSTPNSLRKYYNGTIWCGNAKNICKNISISNNTFINSCGRVIYTTNCENVTILNNKIVNAAYTSYNNPNSDRAVHLIIRMLHTVNGVVSGNIITFGNARASNAFRIFEVNNSDDHTNHNAPTENITFLNNIVHCENIVESNFELTHPACVKNINFIHNTIYLGKSTQSSPEKYGKLMIADTRLDELTPEEQELYSFRRVQDVRFTNNTIYGSYRDLFALRLDTTYYRDSVYFINNNFYADGDIGEFTINKTRDKTKTIFENNRLFINGIYTKIVNGSGGNFIDAEQIYRIEEITPSIFDNQGGDYSTRNYYDNTTRILHLKSACRVILSYISKSDIINAGISDGIMYIKDIKVENADFQDGDILTFFDISGLVNWRIVLLPATNMAVPQEMPLRNLGSLSIMRIKGKWKDVSSFYDITINRSINATNMSHFISDNTLTIDTSNNTFIYCYLDDSFVVTPIEITKITGSGIRDGMVLSFIEMSGNINNKLIFKSVSGGNIDLPENIAFNSFSHLSLICKNNRWKYFGR